jgi:putative FmdB family regulatory protein
MPIYAYRCESCGHAKDVLQKMSDPVLTTCPSCGADSFKKQITAAGFQLKGSGWYATDFKGGSGSNAPAVGAAGAAGAAGASAAPSSDSGSSGSSSGGSASSDGGGGGTSASAAGCGGPCACH